MTAPSPVTLRRGAAGDVAAIAAFYRRTANLEWDFLAPHTPQEDLAHFARALSHGPVWIAWDAEAIVGFCAARRGWIDHLFVDHAWHGRGVGRALLARSLRGRRRVRLWTFQRNARSRRFYALQGFAEVRVTDGADNEEKEPDVLLEWRWR
jgi:GNAT superfamily N-acetyltransferase